LHACTCAKTTHSSSQKDDSEEQFGRTTDTFYITSWLAS
jgi:hypothetical protein